MEDGCTAVDALKTQVNTMVRTAKVTIDVHPSRTRHEWPDAFYLQVAHQRDARRREESESRGIMAHVRGHSLPLTEWTSTDDCV